MELTSLSATTAVLLFACGIIFTLVVAVILYIGFKCFKRAFSSSKEEEEIARQIQGDKKTPTQHEETTKNGTKRKRRVMKRGGRRRRRLSKDFRIRDEPVTSGFTLTTTRTLKVDDQEMRLDTGNLELDDTMDDKAPGDHSRTISGSSSSKKKNTLHLQMNSTDMEDMSFDDARRHSGVAYGGGRRGESPIISDRIHIDFTTKDDGKEDKKQLRSVLVADSSRWHTEVQEPGNEI